jgi:hypothetical protein
MMPTAAYKVARNRLRAAIAILPVEMTWNGATYDVAADALETAKDGEMHGIHLDADLMVYACLDDFPTGTSPQLQARVSVGGTQYIVARRAATPGDPGLRLWLRETSR